MFSLWRRQAAVVTLIGEWFRQIDSLRRVRSKPDQARTRKDLDIRSCHENLALAKRKSEGLGSSSGRSRCPPVLQRFPSEDAERFAGNKIALNAEGIVDGGLNGQEALR